MLKRIFLSALLSICSLQAIQIPYRHFTKTSPIGRSPLVHRSPSGTIGPHHPAWTLQHRTLHLRGRQHRQIRAKMEIGQNRDFLGQLTQPSLQFGINSWLDFQFNPTLFYNYTSGAGKWALGDMPIGFDIQLFHTSKIITAWNIALKLALKRSSLSANTGISIRKSSSPTLADKGRGKPDSASFGATSSISAATTS